MVNGFASSLVCFKFNASNDGEQTIELKLKEEEKQRRLTCNIKGTRGSSAT